MCSFFDAIRACALKIEAGKDCLEKGIAGTTGGLLLAGLAIAQSPSPTPPAPSQPVIAQSAPDAAMARHTMEGQVTSVNPDKGRLYVKTTEGRMLLHFPTSALQSVRKGDSVTIELAMKDNGPALKMMK